MTFARVLRIRITRERPNIRRISRLNRPCSPRDSGRVWDSNGTRGQLDESGRQKETETRLDVRCMRQ